LPFISETVQERPVVTMDHYLEVIGSRLIRISPDNLERWDARGQFLWQISMSILVPFDLDQPNSAEEYEKGKGSGVFDPLQTTLLLFVGGRYALY